MTTRKGQSFMVYDLIMYSMWLNLRGHLGREGILDLSTLYVVVQAAAAIHRSIVERGLEQRSSFR